MSCPQCGTAAMPGASVWSQCGSLPVGLATSDAVTERRVLTVLFGDLVRRHELSEALTPSASASSPTG